MLNTILIVTLALGSVLLMSCSGGGNDNKTGKDTSATNAVIETSNKTTEVTVKKDPGIADIPNINVSINQGAQYSMPSTVEAKLSDNTSKMVSVVWSPAAADVNTPGTFLFEGTAAGYDKKIVLQLIVKPVVKEVKLDKTLKTKLDTFFSNFSEAYVKPFEEGEIKDEALIDFAIQHIIINNWNTKNNMVEQRANDPNNGYIKRSNIDLTTYRYFGKKVKAHKEDYYTFPFASGEAYTFSQIDKLQDIGGGFYTADISIYMASSGFTGDSHASLDNWKKNDPSDVPVLQKKMTSKIKKVLEDGSERYILISYKNK